MNNRTYKVNEDFFNKWSHDMAYILGFITADGSVMFDSYTLNIEINKKDIEVLTFIKRKLRSDHNIKTKDNKSRLRIHSKKIIESLKQYNIVQNKTGKEKINFSIPSKYRGDYLRGVFDGDGWIYKRRNGIEGGICSASKKFLEDINNICKNLGKIRTRIDKRGDRKPLYELDFYGNKKMLKLRKLIYTTNQFALKRKYDIFFSDFYIKSKRLWTKKEMAFLLMHKNKPHEWIAKKLNRSKKSVNIKSFRLRCQQEKGERSEDLSPNSSIGSGSTQAL